MPWLRLWIDILDDADIHGLPLSLVGAWTLLLAAAKKYDRQGQLPPIKTLAFWVHHPQETVTAWLEELVTAGFVEGNGVTYSMHGWERWQEPKDRTNAERQARHKAKVKAEKKSPPAPPKESNTERESEGTVTQTPLLTPGNGSVTALPESEPFDPGPPDSPPPAMDPEEARVCGIAERVGGDVSWATWASSRFRLGDKPHVIEAAIDEAVNCGKVNQKYVAKIAARYAAEGIPGPNGYHIGNGKSRPTAREDGLKVNPPAPDDSPYRKQARSW